MDFIYYMHSALKNKMSIFCIWVARNGFYAVVVLQEETLFCSSKLKTALLQCHKWYKTCKTFATSKLMFALQLSYFFLGLSRNNNKNGPEMFISNRIRIWLYDETERQHLNSHCHGNILDWVILFFSKEEILKCSPIPSSRCVYFIWQIY